jgi:hypothetical protein
MALPSASFCWAAGGDSGHSGPIQPELEIGRHHYVRQHSKIIARGMQPGPWAASVGWWGGCTVG